MRISAGVTPSGFAIDRLQHSLQTATRALRDDAGDAWVVAALLHDIGDGLAPENHGAFAASILAPYVPEQVRWVVEHHPIFQGYYFFHHFGHDRHQRERFRGHPHFDACERFCRVWDQVSFDPDHDTLPLEAFDPILRRVIRSE